MLRKEAGLSFKRIDLRQNLPKLDTDIPRLFVNVYFVTAVPPGRLPKLELVMLRPPLPFLPWAT